MLVLLPGFIYWNYQLIKKILNAQLLAYISSGAVHGQDYMHCWEGEMGSSQHKSPHQVRALRQGLDVVTSAEISPYRRTNDAFSLLSYEYISETSKSNCAVKRFGESAKWPDLTIRLVVKANSMSTRTQCTVTFVLQRDLPDKTWGNIGWRMIFLYFYR